MGILIQDVRYSFRIHMKNPGLPALAVLTVALGIATNSTIFSWINSTLPNPVPGAARTGDLVSVMRGERSEHPTPPFSYLDYRNLRGDNRSLSGLLAGGPPSSATRTILAGPKPLHGVGGAKYKNETPLGPIAGLMPPATSFSAAPCSRVCLKISQVPFRLESNRTDLLSEVQS